MSLNNRRDVQKFRPAQPGAKPSISDGMLFDDDCLDEASRQSVMREVQGSSKPKPLTTTQQQQIDELINKGSSKAAVVGNGSTTPPPATYQRNTVGGMTPSQLAQMLRQEAVTTTSDPRRASAQLSSTPTKRHTDQSVGTSSSAGGGGGYVLPPSPSRRAQSGSSLPTSSTTNTTPSSSAVPASSKMAPSSSAQLPVRSSKVPVQGGGVYDSSSSATSNNSRATHQSHTIGGGGGDGELLGVMIQRLRTIENSQRMMQLEIKEKAKKIIELEDRYASEKLARKEAEESKEALAQELSDIMEFLEEYGLSWVGKDVDEISDQGTPRQRSTSTPSSHKQPPGGGKAANGGGRVLGRRQSTADDDDDEDVGVHANIQQSNLPLGSGLVFDNSQHQTEEGRGRGGRSSASAVQQFRHDQHLKDGELIDLPPGPLNSTQKPAASLNANQRTVNTSADITPTPPPPAPEGGGDGGRRAGSNPRGFSLYEGTFDSQSTTPAVDAEEQQTGEPSAAALTPTSSTSALPPSIVAAQQQRHQQYLEEKKRTGNNNATSTSSSSTSATTAVSNAILNARKLKKLPFSLERFIKNCGILSDHVGEKAFMALHSGDNRGSNNKRGTVGASLAAGSSPLPSDNTSKPPSDGAGRKRILQEREKVFVVIYNDGICVNGGLFRPYGWPLCDAFLNDILDGFYPYEFKDKYPDGFPVEPLDHSREYHDAHSSSTAPSGGRIHDSQSSSPSSSQHKPISKEQFLKNLPSQSITKAGKIVDVQSAVRGRYGVDGNGAGGGVVVGAGGTAARALSTPQLLSTIKGDTAAAGELVRRQQESPVEAAEAPEIGRRITTVQIKLPGGEKCVLHMFFRDTIANVRAEFKKAVPQMFPKRRGGIKDDGGVDDEGWYEFRSMFPRVECTDHTKSLQELELVPSCTLMLLRINNQTSGDASTTTAE